MLRGQDLLVEVLQRIGLEIQDKPRFKKRVSSQVPSKFQKSSDDRVYNFKFNIGKGTNSPIENPTCGKCGNMHYGD